MSASAVGKIPAKEDIYFNQLDGIRFIAVFLVLFDHWMSGYIPFPLGPLGVNMFFVLSGFLITRILIESKHKYAPREGGLGIYLKKFYIRRTLRIFPIYYLTIFVLFALNVPPVREKLAWCLLYATNIYVAHYDQWLGVIDHFWSLAVEEQFYVFFPLVVFFFPTRHLEKLLWVFIAGSVLLRLYYYLQGGSWAKCYVLMPTSLDAFGLGGLMAYLFIFKKDSFRKLFSRRYLVWLSLGGVAGIILWQQSAPVPSLEHISYVVFERLTSSIFCFFLIGNAVYGYTGVMKAFLEHPASVYLGKISYGLYLYHNFVFNHFHTPPSHPVYKLMHRIYGHFPALADNYFFQFVMYFAITVLVATVSWYLIEKPINDLKNKFRY